MASFIPKNIYCWRDAPRCSCVPFTQSQVPSATYVHYTPTCKSNSGNREVINSQVTIIPGQRKHWIPNLSGYGAMTYLPQEWNFSYQQTVGANCTFIYSNRCWVVILCHWWHLVAWEVLCSLGSISYCPRQVPMGACSSSIKHWV